MGRLKPYSNKSAIIADFKWLTFNMEETNIEEVKFNILRCGDITLQSCNTSLIELANLLMQIISTPEIKEYLLAYDKQKLLNGAKAGDYIG